jgi:deoxyadenosine/deoxycytidine kinase
MSTHPTASAIARRFPYVTIEGCIGVGKTTLTHLLAQALGAKPVLEVVEENPFLPDFYRDKAANAFKTQMFFLLSRFKQQEELVQGDLFEKNLVADYLFAKDRIFAELTLQSSELALYDQIFQALSQRTRRPDLVIYLSAPMPLVLERIRRRGRDFEQSIDRGYLEDLVDGYGRFFASFDEAPLLVVDTTDLNFPERPADFQVFLEALASFDLPNAAAKALESRKVLRGPTRQTLLL